jgi:putative membrane protein
MARLLKRWAILVAAIIGASMLAGFVPFLSFSADYGSPEAVGRLFLGAAALALLNSTLGSLLKLLTLPFNCLTLGLVGLVVNALMLMAAASLGLGFRVEGLFSAMAGSAMISFINALLNGLIPDESSERD